MVGLDGIEVVVLAGGLGTRIRGVLGDTPKVLAPINGRPFLDHLLDHLARLGAGRAVLSLGHLADKVTAHLDSNPPPLPVDTIVETEPLGTGGAMRLVTPRLTTDPVMLLNGDTWLEVDFASFLAAHRSHGRLCSILCVEVPDVSRYGRVEIGPDGTLAAFVEKDPAFAGSGWINGGAVLFSKEALALLAGSSGPSIERDFLAALPAGSIHAHLASGTFIDIGTPDSLAQAPSLLPHA
ncbi:Nucleoside-diphosphate-sugar pyrophosphorylase [Magnetospirillum sp. LM-5]|uniref:nucleotidyltransferase family protein n=1 Tax=Magnetospirillum sp. LM-5 TaxID=2681466 RepID=UPI0013841D5B|nr:nucleotidyltransferase family protein [Magnetospirillum sp. LM-5]CAA7618793.1 Nucleoside-diphosphate-sugar pyrophosphorylase [Magnetospirillum sp. LM-5]